MCRPVYAWVYGTSHLYLRFSYTRFPSWRCLHAVYITRRFRTGLFTRCFSYLAFQTPLTCIIHRFHYTRIQSTRSTPPGQWPPSNTMLNKIDIYCCNLLCLMTLLLFINYIVNFIDITISIVNCLAPAIHNNAQRHNTNDIYCDQLNL